MKSNSKPYLANDLRNELRKVGLGNISRIAIPRPTGELLWSDAGERTPLSELKLNKNGIVGPAAEACVFLEFDDDIPSPEWLDQFPFVGVQIQEVADWAPKLLAKSGRLFEAGFVPVRVTLERSSKVQVFAKSEIVPHSDILGGLSFGSISMSSLGKNGRFANQLLQYAFLKLYSLRAFGLLELPHWDGCELFGLEGGGIRSKLPELKYFAFDDDDRFLWTLDAPPLDLDFWGYFQELPTVWRRHRQLLRTLFEFQPGIQRELERARKRLPRAEGAPLIAVHVRRGDYLTSSLPQYRPVPLDWIRVWIAERCRVSPSARVYVASDELDVVLPALEDFHPLSSRDTNIRAEVAHLLDFELLKSANQIAVINSSFSRTASILASDDQEAWIVNFDEEGFVRYEPWIDPNFWARFEGKKPADPTFGSSVDAVQRRSLYFRMQVGRQGAA